MKKEHEVDEVFDEVSPLLYGLSSNELFNLAGFCVLELVIRNIGFKNFNDKCKEEVYKELELILNKLNKQIKIAFKLSSIGK